MRTMSSLVRGAGARRRRPPGAVAASASERQRARSAPSARSCGLERDQAVVGELDAGRERAGDGGVGDLVGDVREQRARRPDARRFLERAARCMCVGCGRWRSALSTSTSRSAEKGVRRVGDRAHVGEIGEPPMRYPRIGRRPCCSGTEDRPCGRGAGTARRPRGDRGRLAAATPRRPRRRTRTSVRMRGERDRRAVDRDRPARAS